MHQEISELLIIPFKPLKIVIMSREDYNGLVPAVGVYEPTSTSGIFRNFITVTTGREISRAREPHIGLYSLVSPLEIC